MSKVTKVNSKLDNPFPIIYKMNNGNWIPAVIISRGHAGETLALVRPQFENSKDTNVNFYRIILNISSSNHDCLILIK